MFSSNRDNAPLKGTKNNAAIYQSTVKVLGRERANKHFSDNHYLKWPNYKPH